MPTLQSSAVLLLFSILIGLSCSLDPRDPNVCSTWESFTTSVKESYLHPYDQVGEEPCWDPRTSYKCMITYKTAYRQAVKTDYRKRYQCCPGYYESRGRCVPRCTKECVHGRCVAPDRCQCEGGWRGDDCSSDCDDKHWGANCKQQCKCENGALCDPVKGSCRCPPGFNGRYCEESCPAGTFGKRCLQRCKCATGGSCDKATGECVCRDGFTGTYCETSCRRKCQARCPCQNGGICKGKGICACPPGWTGPVCTERCPEGRFGPNCTEECVCHNNGKCDAETGQCQCAKGFTGHRCKEECAAGSYGQDCKGVCDCANGARCYNIDGACLCEPGFSGPHCRDRMCPDGIYGMHCERTCLCQDKHTLSCHPMKGECTCQPGWAGLYCNETCAHGFYGHGCLEPCLCVNGGVCDGATGRCHCAPGFTGLHCENPCKSGTYGKNCSLECSCKNYVDCSPIDGTCFCKEGKLAKRKTKTYRTWGPGCNATCHCANGAKCNPADGSCTCTAGWQGARCDQPCPVSIWRYWQELYIIFTPEVVKDVGKPGIKRFILLQDNEERCFTGSVMSRLNPGERESWGAIAGIVVLVILVVLLLALLLLYRRRQKEKQNNTPTVSFSTSRTVNSEYAVPGTALTLNHAPFLLRVDFICSLISQHLFPAELKDSAAVSSSSLNSENPYATIKDLPGLPLPFCPPESSYMEMKSAVPRERAYTEITPPPPFHTCQSSHGHTAHEDPQSHYDLPVNSHIPGHYDLPPVRRPPSPRRSPQ
uniref:Platelet endothelial aggregation receptor 1 n=1 Tax=Neolamprologus brichardi TaxID=32507 RepID=A0A3Q4GJH5_NEOBR